MMSRFLTGTEKKYQKMFPKDGTLPYYFESDDNRFEKLLEKAIERGTPVNQDELIEILGGKELYELEKSYLKEWGYPNAK